VTRRLVFALGAMATAQAAVYIARPMTSYRLLGLGGNARDVGLVTAAFAIIPLFLAIPLGRFADRRRPGPLLVVGCAVQAAACLLLGAVESMGAIAAANALLGLGHLGLALGVQHVIARESEQTNHDRHFGLLTVGVSFGQLVGPLIAGGIVGQRGGASLATAAGHAMFVAAAIAALATATAVLSARGPDVPVPLEPQGAARGRIYDIATIRGVPAGIFASIAVLSSADVLTAYLPVLGEKRGIDPGIIGVLLALRAAASMAARVGIVPLVRRLGRLRLISISAAVAAAAIVALTLTESPIVLGILMVIAGYGLGFGQPLTMTMVVQRVPHHWAATALGIRLTGNRLGQVAGPALAGLIAGGVGVSSVFWLLGGTLVASAAAVQRPALEREDKDAPAPAPAELD
jgi:MFS family permease